ncbi:uncharacterized protein [Apostichopus japonicus]|uniref:uncharacterized protein n=1 Tax=Stichopus japonicus TaxID=307972 RepID=UPI003AB1EB22
MKLSVLDAIIIFGACLFIEWTEGQKPCYCRTNVNKEGKSEWIKEGDNCNIITFGGVTLEEDGSTKLKRQNPCYYKTNVNNEGKSEWIKEGDNCDIITFGGVKLEEDESTKLKISREPGSSYGGENSAVEPTSTTATTKEKEPEVSTTKDVSIGPGSSNGGDNNAVYPTSMTATTKEKEPEVSTSKDERPPGFEESFGGSYYKVVPIHTLNRTTAQQTCESFSSHLVFIESEEENNFINSLVNSDQHQYWIGLNGLEQNLHWDDQNPVVYENFGTFSFNDKSGCYRISKQDDGIKWRDHPCSNLYGYICEYEY